MKMGTKRTRVGAKKVAQERKHPRPIKVLPIAFHEDEKGKVLKDEEGKPIVAIARTFRVAPFDMIALFVDSQCNEHRLELKEGELDFTSGTVCVKEEEYDADGNLLAFHNLSHEMQRRPNMRASNFADGHIAFSRSLQNSPNAALSRFNPHTAKRAGILDVWQMQADSPDATWLDGRCPTKKEVAEAQKEYEERKADRRRGRTTTSPTQTQPAGVIEDEEGENFDDFNQG